MDLNALELFVAVAETSSFSAAARRLGLPKSTVSRGIARLEAELAVRLVHRTTRKVSLSSAGAALQERVAPQLAALRKAIGDLPEAEEKPSGTLRLTANVDFGLTLLPEMVAQFLQRCPGVSVEAHVTNRVVDLVGERFDLAFRATAGRLKDSALVARKAGAMAMELYASPGYLARRGTPRTPKDLAGHEWVAFRKQRAVSLDGPDGAEAVAVNGRLTGDDMFYLREAARFGGGIAALPTYLAQRDVAAGDLVRVLPRWDVPTGTLWIVIPGGAVPKKTSAFRDFALEFLRTHPLSPAA